MTQVTDPRARCQIVPGRKLNPWLALSESLWLLAGRRDIAALLPYNKGITEFSDNGVTMYGAYGFRIKEQLPLAIRRLEDSDTDRRVVIQIWDQLDLMAETKDPPCNTQIMFKVRGEKLYMTVTNRSNDLHWGLHAVNLFQFGVLQEYVACRLGVGMGSQTHYSDSLHIYTDEKAQKITERMIAELDEPIEEIPSESWLFPNPFPKTAQIDKDFAKLCSDVLDGKLQANDPLSTPFLEFAEDFLAGYRGHEGGARNAGMYKSWVRMGREHSPDLFKVGV